MKRRNGKMSAELKLLCWGTNTAHHLCAKSGVNRSLEWSGGTCTETSDWTLFMCCSGSVKVQL